MNDLACRDLIQAVERASSPAQLVSAVQALVASGEAAAIPTLIAVLGYNNPVAAVAAVDGLVSFGAVAVQPLMEQLDEYNYGARAYSIRALAAIADPRAMDVLIPAAATDFAPSVRRAAAKGLGSLDWNLLSGKARSHSQALALQTLLSILDDPDWSIRYAAVVGLSALAHSPDLRAQIQVHLKQIGDADVAVRSRLLLAQKVLSDV
ncbi:HEAT repeat domain-containing protein [Aliterella atlantica]|uniref:Phycocyanobilin lyase n=1 Tax=Aliterella atlantica CENA595 TaxID=1618023 RepID=A0A0D8ZX55_9CYAN|nr:HEAT repeat domain-containing protein [Aliterella atlantica]KJH71791.1 phycocyanobilin lyase [Aliterella atlantica CENA595]